MTKWSGFTFGLVKDGISPHCIDINLPTVSCHEAPRLGLPHQPAPSLLAAQCSPQRSLLHWRLPSPLARSSRAPCSPPASLQPPLHRQKPRNPRLLPAHAHLSPSSKRSGATPAARATCSRPSAHLARPHMSFPDRGFLLWLDLDRSSGLAQIFSDSVVEAAPFWSHLLQFLMGRCGRSRRHPGGSPSSRRP